MVDANQIKHHLWDLIGAIHEVHRELGPGLNEYVYQEGLRIQLDEDGIEYEKELTFHPLYHGKEMETTYRLDFLCKKDVIVELKAIDSIGAENRAQLYNYMHLFKPTAGILVNFAPKRAEIETYLFDKENNEILTRDGTPLFRTLYTAIR